MGFPSADSPTKVYFTPSPSATMVRVRLLGAGPGSNLDLAVLSFHAPTRGLSCACRVEQATAANTATATNIKIRFIFCPPWAFCSVVRLVVILLRKIYLDLLLRGSLPCANDMTMR